MFITNYIIILLIGTARIDTIKLDNILLPHNRTFRTFVYNIPFSFLYNIK